jgi:hypothetical protein
MDGCGRVVRYLISMMPCFFSDQDTGGVTNGNDLVAAYARASKHFPRAIADIGCELTDVGDRPQKYTKGQAAFTLGAAWLILMAIVAGWFGNAKAKRR